MNKDYTFSYYFKSYSFKFPFFSAQNELMPGKPYSPSFVFSSVVLNTTPNVLKWCVDVQICDFVFRMK